MEGEKQEGEAPGGGQAPWAGGSAEQTVWALKVGCLVALCVLGKARFIVGDVSAQCPVSCIPGQESLPVAFPHHPLVSTPP